MTNTSMVLERCAESLVKAQQHWTGHHPNIDADDTSREVRPWTIALTREAGTPGTSIAREIGTRLNWHVYDHELVELIAREMGLRASLLDSVDECHKSWLLDSIEGMSSAPNISEGGYARHLVETIFSLGTHGRCVIVGRGAAQLLPPASTLRVRLVGRLEDRIATVISQRSLSHEQAEHWVKETDRERIHFVKSHFFKDPTDPSRYDLILNTSRWSVSECADFTIHALQFAQSHVGNMESKAR
jgi:cytidylate kinase